jgi:hypothetical protein
MSLLKTAQAFEYQVSRLGNLPLLVQAISAQNEATKAAETARTLYTQFLDSQQEKDQ